MRRTLANKWLKTEALLSDARLAPYIPRTRNYTAANLRQMLNDYKDAVIKPVSGSRGVGVIRIQRIKDGYRSQSGRSIRSFQTIDACIGAVNRIRLNRPYIVQRGVQLATIDGRPLDYRVKITRDKTREWRIIAMVGRLARPGLFVTNLSQGGRQLRLADAIQKSISSEAVSNTKQEMRRIARIGAEVIGRRYPGLRRLGFDYGLDKNGRIWIFEVNTSPR